MTEAKKKRGRPKRNVYDVGLTMNGTEYTSSGNTLMEAFDGYADSHVSLFAKGIILKTIKNPLVVKKGDEEQTYILSGWQVKRFFANPTARKLIAKEFII